MMPRCKKTGKVQYRTFPIAQAALRNWLMVDPDAAQDAKRFRIYKCEKCHQLHIGKYHG